MAKVSFKFQALNQCLIYLKQASRLSSLLQEDGHSCDMFVAQIDAIHGDVMVERSRDSQARPQLPRRESSMEISSKVKFRIKMSRSNSRTIEDPYTNISFVRPQSMAQASAAANSADYMDEMKKDEHPTDANKTNKIEEPRFNRYLAPHNNRVQVKRQKSNLITTVQIHSKHSPKSPRAPIKCINFFDEDDLSSGNNSPIIHISDFTSGDGEDPFRKDGKQITFPQSLLAEHQVNDQLITLNKENLQHDFKKVHKKSDLLQQNSDNGTSDLTEL